MNKKQHFHIATSLVLLAILLSAQCAFAQVPRPFLQYIEKQNRVKSGYVKLQNLQTFNNDTTVFVVQDVFFISTPQELKYLVFEQKPRLDATYTYCKSAHSLVTLFSRTDCDYSFYEFDGEIENTKEILEHFVYSAANDIRPEIYTNFPFQRVAPKIDKKNIRYKMTLPDEEGNLASDICLEWEFNKKTFNLIQDGSSLTFGEIDQIIDRKDILEQRLFEYIHPDILDTISFKFNELRKGYDQQLAKEQAKIDSIVNDSIVNLISNNAGMWTEQLAQDEQKDTLFFMPKWKLPSLSGDTIYSDSINSRFLLIDMWYLRCYPCRLVMHDLAAIDTLYDESLLKMVSVNVFDEDTAKINQLIEHLNLKCEVALAYDNRYDIEMSKQMGECQGYPQIYLIDMKTKQVIWYSCGWYDGFTKEIGERLRIEN